MDKYDVKTVYDGNGMTIQDKIHVELNDTPGKFLQAIKYEDRIILIFENNLTFSCSSDSINKQLDVITNDD